MKRWIASVLIVGSSLTGAAAANVQPADAHVRPHVFRCKVVRHGHVHWHWCQKK